MKKDSHVASARKRTNAFEKDLNREDEIHINQTLSIFYRKNMQSVAWVE